MKPPKGSDSSYLNFNLDLPLSPGHFRETNSVLKRMSTKASLLEQVANLTPNLVAVYSLKTGQYIYVNNALKPILGYEKEDWMEKGVKYVSSKVHPDDLKRIMQESQKALEEIQNKPFQNAPIVEFEYRIKHADGTFRWLKTYGTVFDRDELGKVEHVINISLDITSIKATEEKLVKLTEELEQKVEERASEISSNAKKFQTLLENSSDAIILVNKAGKIQYVSPGIKKVLGFTPEEFLNIKKPANLIHPEDRKNVFKLFTLHFKKPEDKIKTGFRVKNKAGKYCWIEVVASNLIKKESIKAVVLNFRDVTAQIESDEISAEEMRNTAMRLDIKEALSKKGELKQTLEYCAQVILERLQSTVVRIWTLDEKNHDLNLFVKTEKKEFSLDNVPIWTKIKNGNIPKKPYLTNNLLQSEHFKEKAWFKKYKINSFAAYPLILDNGLVGTMTIISRNEISPHTHEALRQTAYSIAQSIGRFRAEIALRKSEEKYHTIFSTLTEGVVLQDKDGKVLAANSSAESILGLNFDEMVEQAGRPSRTYINEDSSLFDQQNFPFIKALKTGKPQLNQIMGILFNKQGLTTGKKTTWISTNSIPLLDENGVAFAVASSFQDITEQKKLEKQKDEFISIASHELKTPLTTIKSFTEILKMQFGKEEKASHYLDKMNGEIDRLTSLVNELLDVSKIQSGGLTLNKERVDVDKFLKEVIEDIQATTNQHKIIYKKNTSGKISMDKYRIYQVLINLISNAMKYSPKSNKVIISTEKKSDRIIFSVKDFGIGITERDRKKIFDPFFQANTTIRQSHSGLGLGLHIAKEIIDKHGGKISVFSKKGVGSIFKFSLPKI